MSSGRNTNEEQHWGKTVALAATAGAVFVGALTVISSMMIEEDEPQSINAVTATGGNRPRRNSGSFVRRQFPDTHDILEEWLAEHSDVTTRGEDAESEGVTCKICLDKRIKYVLGCGHALCWRCTVDIVATNRRCPFDRKPVTEAPKKLFL